MAVQASAVGSSAVACAAARAARCIRSDSKAVLRDLQQAGEGGDGDQRERERGLERDSAVLPRPEAPYRTPMGCFRGGPSRGFGCGRNAE